MNSLPEYPEASTYNISPKGLAKIADQSNQPKYPNQHLVWTDHINVELPIRLGNSGISALPPTTLVRDWQQTLHKYGKRPALSVKRGGVWNTYSFEQYHHEIIRFAKALIALKLPQFTGVNIIGFNAPEWNMSFYGTAFARCIPVGIYSTNNQEVCQYIATHSQARVVIAQNKNLAKKYYKLLQTGKIDRIILYSDEVGYNSFQGKMVSWESFLATGSHIADQQVQQRTKKITPGQCCTLVYTSGTTGMPKGVMISHDNCTWTPRAQNSREGYASMDGGRCVSFLPLSHVAALYFDVLCSMIYGCHVYFAEPTALQGTLIQTLLQVKPTFFFAVPRVWQKIYAKIKQEQNKKTGLAKTILGWAQGIGIEGTIKEGRNESTSAQFLMAKKLVFDKVKTALGLEQSKYFGFGAAPLDPAVRKYFLSMNFLLLNAYGMTETSAPHSGTPITKFNPTEPKDYFEVGFAMPGGATVIKSEDANEEGGEICMRGRNICMGYFKNAEESNKVIDSEGFLHSGDLGRIDKDGYLFITGRAKEIIITAGGQNIPPILIENQIKKALPCLSNVMVIGEQKPYLTCLVSLLEDPPQSGKLDKNASSYLSAHGCPISTVKQAGKHPSFRTVIMEGLKVANQKAISRAQMVQNFYLMPEDFSVDNGTLTPSLKLKRKQAIKKYAAEAERMYVTPKL